MTTAALDAGHHCANAVDTSFVSLGAGKIAVLGVVQGITELLPISSTAHMRVVPALFGWPDPGSAFSAAMQLAALTAVLVYFRSDILAVAKGFFVGVAGGDRNAPAFKLGVGIVIATIPIGIAGVLLSRLLNHCQSPLRAPMVIGIACVAMAVLMALAERIASHKRDGDGLTYTDAFLVGLAQVGALVPGFSRSGSTLTGALFLGFKREDAARVSFLLGIPAITLAGLSEIYVLYRAGLPADGWYVLSIGLVVSSLSSFVAIWGLMRLLERFSTWPLIFYRAAFGLLVIVGAQWHWIT